MSSKIITRLNQLVLIALSLCLSSLSFADKLTASVDNTQISINDSIVLIVRYDGSMGFGSPDWDDVENDFDIINQGRSTSIKTINGNTSTVTEWSLTLTPKRVGQLTIPAIQYKGDKSTSIKVEVSNQTINPANLSRQEFFFETSLSPGPYYVQQQIFYTERLYYTINHDNAVLSELKVADAQVELLVEPKPSIKVIDGRRIGVYERRVAIFPQQSGELVIPAQRFTADIRNRRDLFGRGRTATARTELQRLDVLPIPTSYPNDPWIPSKNLTLRELPNSGSDNWVVGEAVTRTLELTAEGLMANQVPAIPLIEVEGLRYYPEQSEQENLVTKTGAKAIVRQSVAIVPTQPGPLTLPAVKVSWWNTQTEQVQIASLPARTIMVGEPKGTASIPLSAATISNDVGNGSDEVNTAITDRSPQLSNGLLNNSTNIPTWLIILMSILVISNGLFIWLWLRNRASHSLAPSEEIAPRPRSSAKRALSELEKRCQSNQPAAIKMAFNQWAMLHYRLAENASPLAVRAHIIQPELVEEIAQLDRALYGSQVSSSAWNNGSRLWQLIQQEAQLDGQESSEVSDLTSLYPT